MFDPSVVNQVLLAAQVAIGAPLSIVEVDTNGVPRTDATGKPATRAETPEEYQGRFLMKVAELTALLRSDKHPARLLIEAMADPKTTKVFIGKVNRIIKDKKSTRGIVLLETGNERTATYKINGQEYTAPPGIEVVRTDRTDTAFGLAMAHKVRSLCGQTVVVWVELQVMDNGNKVRVLRHIEPVTGSKETEEQAE